MGCGVLEPQSCTAAWVVLGRGREGSYGVGGLTLLSPPLPPPLASPPRAAWCARLLPVVSRWAPGGGRGGGVGAAPVGDSPPPRLCEPRLKRDAAPRPAPAATRTHSSATALILAHMNTHSRLYTQDRCAHTQTHSHKETHTLLLVDTHKDTHTLLGLARVCKPVLVNFLQKQAETIALSVNRFST